MSNDSCPLPPKKFSPAEIAALDKVYDLIPNGYGECPVCHGTGINHLSPEEQLKYWGNPKQVKCNNCGGQTMSGSPRGYVRLNKEGKPCIHRYIGKQSGRCYVVYDCIHCGDHYDIDSGD